MKHAGSIYFNKKLIIFAKRITRISIYHVMIPTLFVWLAILKKLVYWYCMTLLYMN